ncbi:hypothetical protein NW765_005495 [Fusarium oxysporum]|nr:hypothetical protein NW765_005495 [Fusarium oxysporum]KAJ4281758.1 hypothetical protein NW764_004441 [Fusarium oxysporum]
MLILLVQSFTFLVPIVFDLSKIIKIGNEVIKILISNRSFVFPADEGLGRFFQQLFQDLGVFNYSPFQFVCVSLCLLRYQDNPFRCHVEDRTSPRVFPILQ